MGRWRRRPRLCTAVCKPTRAVGPVPNRLGVWTVFICVQKKSLENESISENHSTFFNWNSDPKSKIHLPQQVHPEHDTILLSRGARTNLERTNTITSERYCEKLCTENGKLVCSAKRNQRCSKISQNFLVLFSLYKHLTDQDSE